MKRKEEVQMFERQVILIIKKIRRKLVSENERENLRVEDRGVSLTSDLGRIVS